MTPALVVVTLCALASPAERGRELDEAEALAVRGQIDAAIDAYATLLERGDDFAGLRYNLGTLHLERGDVGHAVLHLKVALRMDPRHDDARYNLERAQEARADELEGARASPGLVASLVERVRSSEASLAFALALGLFAIALALWPWTHRGTAQRKSCTAAVVVTAAMLALSSWLLLACVARDELREGVVLDDEVRARAGPSDDAAVSFTAHAGLSGAVVEEEGAFVRLRLENGLDAWFPRSALGLLGR